MAAADHLQPGQFFHGTHEQLEPGEVLRPGREVGRGRGHSVWLTPSADDARGWGTARARRSGFAADEGGATVPVHVYEVEPENARQNRNGYWQADRAIVRRRVED